MTQVSAAAQEEAKRGKACLGGCLVILFALCACGWAGVVVLAGKLWGWWG